MIVPKGYRAREAAAKLRNNRKLVSDEVRAQRASMLPGGDEAEDVVAVVVADPAADAAKAAEVAAAAAAAEAAAAANEAAEAEKAAAEAAEAEKKKAAAAAKAKAKKDK